MRTEETKGIAEKLTVDLPEHYITFLSGFEGLNNPELDIGHFLYSKADDIIHMNQMMGFHLNDKIIKRKLIIGDNGGGDFYLIDLADPSDPRVYVFDHEEAVENNFDEKTETFNWVGFEKYDTLDSYRSSLQEMFK